MLNNYYFQTKNDNNMISVYFYGFTVYMEPLNGSIEEKMHRAKEISSFVKNGEFPDAMRRQIEIVKTIMRYGNDSARTRRIEI